MSKKRLPILGFFIFLLLGVPCLAQETVPAFSPHFQIQFLELAFSNGKYYQVTGLKNPPPTYYLKIRAVGNGLLKGTWLLDQQPIGFWAVPIKEGQIAWLRGRDVTPLPQKDPGLHKLTIGFTNNVNQMRLPILRYFVAEAGAIRILSPEPGSKMSRSVPPRLVWEMNTKLGAAHYQLFISETPLQFLTDEQMVWLAVGHTDHYAPDLTACKEGTWLYWQIRAVNASGRVLTTSENTSFKLIK